MKTASKNFFAKSMDDISKIAQDLKYQAGIFEEMAQIISNTRQKRGRLFFCGVGGGAGNGTHATGDLFKSCEVKAICLTDNIPTITAITNDEGWSEIFIDQLRIWNMQKDDVLFVFSVGGGDIEKNISANIVKAVAYAKEKGSCILGVVGKTDGYTAQNGTAVIVIPTVNANYRTTHTESWQNYIAHLLTESLRERSAKWESVE